ncbi:lactonase family protein [Roseiconus nitratireducens]|nr:lactonase family protein [Roseiconus nitratireducens]
MRACLAPLLLLLCMVPKVGAETLVYVGTYTRGDTSSQGIYVATLDESDGSLSAPRLAATAENPSFLAIHPDGKTLYAVSEVSDGEGNSGALIAYSIHADGTLKELNTRRTGGGGACHVAVDPTGQCVAVANYGGGSCASFPIRQDGSLGPTASFHQHVGGSGVNPRRQSAPHAHSVNFNRTGTQAFVADLGMDQIRLYDVDPQSATLTPSSPPFVALPPGSGPRHFCLTPDEQIAFTNLEMTSQVAMLDYAPSEGTLSVGPILSTLPSDNAVEGNSTAECLVHPSQNVVYVSNRGHNSIAMFRYDEAPMSLTALGNQSTEGEIPRGFGITPSGNYLVVGNQRSETVVTLAIDPKTGQLSSTGHQIQIGSPVNVRFLQR